MDTTSNTPADLSPKAATAFRIIVQYLAELGITATWVTSFYSQAEWRKSGERYCNDAQIVVVYDGSPLKRVFNMDRAAEEPEPYKAYEEMQRRLGEAGLFFEEGTGWYAGVYSDGAQ